MLVCVWLCLELLGLIIIYHADGLQVAFPDPYELANAAKNLANVLDAQEKTEEAEQLVITNT